MKILRTLVLFSVIFGLGYYTGQKPDVVKQGLRDLSGQVLENTIGYDQNTSLQRQMLEAKEGFLDGRAYLLENHFEEASGEFDRALRHLDQAVALDPQAPLAQKIQTVKQKIREAQQSLAQGRSLPPHVLDELRQELQSAMP
jgi:tetratricopeptide (TPR) repeat protein